MPETDILIFPEVKDEKMELSNQFYFYKHRSVKGVVKNKILLRYNLISLLIHGEKVLHYANKYTSVKEDQFAVLSSGNCLMTEKIGGNAAYESNLLFFNNTALTNFFIKYAPVVEKIKLKTNLLKEPFVVFKKDGFIENYSMSLEFLAQNKTAIPVEILQIKFEELMFYLLEKYPESILSFQASNSDTFSDFKIRKAVEQNITQNISLNELSFLCNTSVSTFKRRFVKLYNTAPSHYFLQRKMEFAAGLLLKKENPSEIFSKVGYENYSSFSQSFKQIYGISPKQYQQQH